MKNVAILITLVICWGNNVVKAQEDTSVLNRNTVNYNKQRDAVDIIYRVFGKDPAKRIVDTTHPQVGKIYFSGAPGIAYSLQTGVAGVIAGNFAFYLGPDTTTKTSSVLASVQYTQYSQLIVPLRSSMWAKNNLYNFIGEVRFLKYPQDTYGIGSNTKESDAYSVDYNYVRFYQYALKKIKGDFYAGVGFQYDNHWHIKQVSPPPGNDFDKYGFSSSSVSSGLAVNILYNTRKNLLNPEGGSVYANVILRKNFTWLGSNSGWSSAVVDLRKYFRVGNKNNVLAFWTYDWLTLSGKPPYFDLPSNEWDTYSNTARGYVQSRFRGKNMVDLEGEFRFNISRNQLFGGVVFANATSFTNLNNTFDGLLPAAGAGIRIKFNKFSNTNVAIDYAVGKNGSSGVFINLGEVF